MTTYTIHYTDGRISQHDTLDAAYDELGDVEIGAAEQDGLQDEDGGQPMRRLMWATEEDAESDDGSHAIASIRWTE